MFFHTKNTRRLGLFSDSRNTDAVMFWCAIAFLALIILGVSVL
jgi:hypothetical protein